jgi:hypothetical protein
LGVQARRGRRRRQLDDHESASFAEPCGKILLIELGEELATLYDRIDVSEQPLDDAIRLADGRRMWILRTITDEIPERTFRVLPRSVRTIGRAAGADFIVDAALVSRVHCRLTALADGQLEVRDLGSTNGTFVNGNRVEAATLASVDTLGVGRVELIALQEAD